MTVPFDADGASLIVTAKIPTVLVLRHMMVGFLFTSNADDSMKRPIS